ncbi:hypothetical protein Tco_0961851 [Tanacetum coccineum]
MPRGLDQLMERKEGKERIRRTMTLEICMEAMFPRSSSGYVTNWVIVDRLTKECSIDQSVRGGDLLLSAWNRHCRRH